MREICCGAIASHVRAPPTPPAPFDGGPGCCDLVTLLQPRRRTRTSGRALLTHVSTAQARPVSHRVPGTPVDSTRGTVSGADAGPHATATSSSTVHKRGFKVQRWRECYTANQQCEPRAQGIIALPKDTEPQALRINWLHAMHSWHRGAPGWAGPSGARRAAHQIQGLPRARQAGGIHAGWYRPGARQRCAAARPEPLAYETKGQPPRTANTVGAQGQGTTQRELAALKSVGHTTSTTRLARRDRRPRRPARRRRGARSPSLTPLRRACCPRCAPALPAGA